MKKIVIYLISLLPIVGCSDFLEPEQTSIVYNEVFWKSQSEAESGLLGVYSLYRALKVDARNWYQRGDATTGFFNRGWNGGSPDGLYKPGDFSSPTSTTRSWGGLNDYAGWNNFYKVIAHVNLVIAKITNMPESAFGTGKKEQFLGEAYFLRALTYFDILRIWGNAPYIAESIESSSQVIDNDLTPVQIGRTKDVDIAAKVMDDANEALSLLTYQTPMSANWGIRASKASVEMLIGHVNLWLYFLATRDGMSNATQYVTNAVTALESLVANSGCELEDYAQSNLLETLYKAPSRESIFQLSISTDNNESYRIDYGGVENITIKVAALDGDAAKDRANFINFVPYSQKAALYPEYDMNAGTGDIRPNLFFAAWESTYDVAFSDVSEIATDRNLVTWMRKYESVTVDAARQWNEYQAYFAEADIPVFRFTGAKLLLAEAYVKADNNGKALEIVNEIRNRAGLGAYAGNDLLHEVLQQRFGELIGEGQIYFDMVRNNYFPNSFIMDSERYAQQGYYWPVSDGILSSNKQVKQTSYWNGKTTW